MVAVHSDPLRSSATRTARSAARFSTAPARSSWTSASTAPAWAKSPAPPASPRARFMSISPTRTGCSKPSSRRKTLEQGKVAFNFDPERDVATTLREFGQAYIQLLCRPGGGSAIRTVMAIAERMPEVGRRYYEQVLEKTIDRLAAYLEARVKAGTRDRRLPARGIAIHADVPGVAVSAVHFSGRPAAFGGAHGASGRKRDADVSRGVSGTGRPDSERSEYALLIGPSAEPVSTPNSSPGQAFARINALLVLEFVFFVDLCRCDEVLRRRAIP